MSSFDAVKREAIRILQGNGVTPEDAERAIAGLDEEGILQRMRDVKHVEGVVKEVGEIQRQVELDAMMNRIAISPFADGNDLTFLIKPKKSGSPDRRG